MGLLDNAGVVVFNCFFFPGEVFACGLVKFDWDIYHIPTAHGNIVSFLFNTITAFPAYIWCDYSHAI